MSFMARFIFTLIIIDTFFVAFYLGFNSRNVMVVDAKLPPYVAPAEAKPSAGPAAQTPTSTSKNSSAKKTDVKPSAHAALSHAEKNGAHKHKTQPSGHAAKAGKKAEK